MYKSSTFELTTREEVPLPKEAGGARGMATVNLHPDNGTVMVSGSYINMTTPVESAHLHGLSPPGGNSGALITLTVTGGTMGTFSGSGSLTRKQAKGLLDGYTYINVHTSKNQAGEVRGQVPGEAPTQEHCCHCHHSRERRHGGH